MSISSFSSHLINVLYVINILFALTVIFLERKNPTSTLVWILILFILPGIGVIFYLLLSQNITRNKMYKLRAGEHKDYYNLLSKEIIDVESGNFSFSNPETETYKDLIHLHQIQSKAYYSQDNSIEIFIDGKKKFRALFKSIEEAQKHIHVLYFIIKNDSLGKQLLSLLTKKAKEGIEVKLLIDAIGSNSLSPKDFQPLIDAGGKVSSFFPSKLLKYINIRANYRNHRKIVIIDGKTGFIGGFNVGNEYVGLNKRMGYWRDTHLKITGTAVRDLQIKFFMDWRVASAEEVDNYPKYFTKNVYTGNSGIQIVSCGPNSPQEEIKQGFLKMINSAKESIYIQTPYFIPDESIQEALKIAALSGVDVRIMIPIKPDHLFVYWASYSFIGDLLNAGVKAFTYRNGFLHAKTIVVDRKISSVGSANFDIRSFKLNFEINAFIYDFSISEELHEIYENDIKYCDQVTIDKYRNRSNLIKFKESISRLLSPLL